MPASRGFKAIQEGINPEVIADLGFDALIARHNAAPTSGATGTLAGVAGTGSLLVDITGGKLYINTGTKASPTWTVVGTQT